MCRTGRPTGADQAELRFLTTKAKQPREEMGDGHVVTLSQCMHLSNHHAVHFNLINGNYTSMKVEKTLKTKCPGNDKKEKID